jgi:DNA modification methylase
MSGAGNIKTGRAVTNAVDNESLARHRWYPIKEGFSANFVRDSLAEVDKSPKRTTLAIEPFSGSGTTPVECTRLGVDCLAFEVNPFLAFVGRTKLRQADPEKLQAERTKVTRGLRTPSVSPLENVSTFSEGNGKKKWLFNRNVLRAFTGGWQAVQNCNPNHRAFFRLALVRAAMDNCNAYPDGKCLRYKRLDSYDCFDQKQLINRFEHYCKMIEEDLEKVPFSSGLSRVECMDARNILEFDKKRRFDFCVTSPPYLNSFDYSDVYRPELFLTGCVTNNRQLMRIRLRTIRSHLQANWETPTVETFGSLYAKVMKELKNEKIELWNPRIPEMVQAYFEDMECLLETLALRANAGALLKIAVSTSAYGGIVVPVDFILAEIAESVGWELKDVLVVRRLRSSAQNWKHEDDENDAPALRESVVVLRFPNGGKR